MISYSPLVETLKKKGVSIFVLQRDLNNHNLRITLNSGRYLDGKTIDKTVGELCTGHSGGE